MELELHRCFQGWCNHVHARQEARHAMHHVLSCLETREYRSVLLQWSWYVRQEKEMERENKIRQERMFSIVQRTFKTFWWGKWWQETQSSCIVSFIWVVGGAYGKSLVRCTTLYSHLNFWSFKVNARLFIFSHPSHLNPALIHLILLTTIFFFFPLPIFFIPFLTLLTQPEQN